jgi:opacity protein-like surface antigen
VNSEEEGMTKAVRILAGGATLVALAAGTAEAQQYRWDLGLNAGHSWYSWMVDRDATAFEGDARFRQGWLVGAQGGFWFTPQIGLRANATYADRPVWGRGADGTNQNLVNSVNLWSGSGDLMVRLRTANPEWMGAEILPYVALGLGALDDGRDSRYWRGGRCVHRGCWLGDRRLCRRRGFRLFLLPFRGLFLR